MLEDELRETLLSFSHRMGCDAHMMPATLCGDDAEVMIGRYPARVTGRLASGPIRRRV
jgi:hypothetical protein